MPIEKRSDFLWLMRSGALLLIVGGLCGYGMVAASAVSLVLLGREWYRGQFWNSFV